MHVGFCSSQIFSAGALRIINRVHMTRKDGFLCRRLRVKKSRRPSWHVASIASDVFGVASHNMYPEDDKPIIDNKDGY